MLKIYITKEVDKTTLKRMRAIGRAYDVELIEGYKSRPQTFYSPDKSERHLQAIYAFELLLKGFSYLQYLQETKTKSSEQP